MTRKLPVVSVGIPAYNEEANIKALLTSLLAQKNDECELAEIIVVSDGSIDRTAARAKSVADPRVKVLDYRERLGQAARQNDILQKFRGEVLVLLNADVAIADNHFLTELVKPVFSNPDVGVVGGKTVPLPPRTFFEKIVAFSSRLKGEIYEELNQGDNIYLCHGQVRALAKDFAKSLNFPKKIGEDAYSYWECKTRGYRFYYQRKAKVFYRSPQNLEDHLKQSKRFFKGRDLACQANPEIKAYYRIPASLLMRKWFKHLFVNPIFLIAYSFVLVYARLFAVFYHPKAAWEIAESSKALR